tara:strand:- start:3327 stop:4658 length:1332 start_codon:yes stop_codon:yes gene_type:complete
LFYDFIKKITVIGVGYVGLPIAIELAKNNKFKVIGFDSNFKRIDELNKGIDFNNEIEFDRNDFKGEVIFTNDNSKINGSNVFIVTVPTPIDSSNKPDLTALMNAARTIGESLSKTFANAINLDAEILVILESTVFPGLTNELFAPEILSYIPKKYLSKHKIRFGYSPERVSPGRDSKNFKEIIKIISADDSDTLNIVDWIYKECLKCETYRASKIEVAEAAKLLENTQRDLNIALINECVHVFSRMNICTNDVIDAAATKWNFMEVRPGLVGGHCIGVDPFYLTYKAEQLNYVPEVVSAGRRINDGFARWLAKDSVLRLFKANKGLHKYIAYVYGVTFKANCSDLRNSKSIDIINKLKDYGIEVYWHDPIVNKTADISLKETPRLRNLEGDLTNRPQLVFICVGHDEYKDFNSHKYDEFFDTCLYTYDVPNILKRRTEKIIKL